VQSGGEGGEGAEYERGKGGVHEDGVGRGDEVSGRERGVRREARKGGKGEEEVTLVGGRRRERGGASVYDVSVAGRNNAKLPPPSPSPSPPSLSPSPSPSPPSLSPSSAPSPSSYFDRESVPLEELEKEFEVVEDEPLSCVHAKEAQHSNALGVYYYAHGRAGEGMKMVEEAISMCPSYPIALSNYGVMTQNLAILSQSTEERMALYKLSIRAHEVAAMISVTSAARWAHVGLALKGIHEYAMCLPFLRLAVRLDHDYAFAVSGLWNVEQRLGLHFYENATAFHRIKRIVKEGKRGSFDFPVSPMALFNSPASPQLLHLLCSIFKQSVVRQAHRNVTLRPLPPLSSPSFPLPHRGRPLRVGFFSGDFRFHPVAIEMNSVYRRLNRDKVVPIGFSFTPDVVRSSFYDAIRSGCDEFFDIGHLDNADLAEFINAKHVDVLVELGGWTEENRIPAVMQRPAPVQISYLGFLGPMGLGDALDNTLVDRVALPPEYAQYYDEKVLYLPPPLSYFVNDLHFAGVQPGGKGRKNRGFSPSSSPASLLSSIPDIVLHARGWVRSEGGEWVRRGGRDSSEVKTGEDHAQQYHQSGKEGEEREKVVFVSFNRPDKLTRTILSTWANILHRVPTSVLWLAGYGNESRRAIVDVMGSFGIRHDRIAFSSLEDPSIHLERLKLADIYLDTRPYSGGCTTVDVVYSGIPVVTMPALSQISRSTSSIASACGMKELIASSLSQYEDIAVELAANHARRWQYSTHTLKGREGVLSEKEMDSPDTCPLFWTSEWVRMLEKSLRMAAEAKDESGRRWHIAMSSTALSPPYSKNPADLV